MEHHRSVTVCASECPRCGQPNQCAREQNRREGHCGVSAELACWCVGMVFSQELFPQIPTAAIGKACVCRDCAEPQRLAEKPAALNSAPE